MVSRQEIARFCSACHRFSIGSCINISLFDMMLLAGIITLCFTVGYVAEVKYDMILKELESESKNNKERRRLWHRLDWVQKASPVAGVTVTFTILFGWKWILLGLLLGSLRLLILNLGINILSKSKSLLYLSSEGLEGKFKGFEWLYYLFWIVLFILSGYFLII